ncbi:MAG: NAD-dependent deacylase [Deltaproteobacteria bacterium]|nr:NAD-dependent deacylase [Deltaproteobacteria bacterium]
MQDLIDQAAQWLREAEVVMALTGAGISVDSGIPAFRGNQGLWERYDPMEYASIDAFMADPVKVWDMLRELEALVLGAQPNAAHQALSRLEAMGHLHCLVTQNIDGLHQAAGHRRVVEFHGSGRRLVCLSCGRQVSRSSLVFAQMPPRCACGGLIKPDVVFFGEPIPQRAALTAMATAQSCQCMLVVGTSAMVAPASYLPGLAKQAGAKVVEINLEPSPLTGAVADLSIHAPASEVLPRLTEQLESLRH